MFVELMWKNEDTWRQFFVVLKYAPPMAGSVSGFIASGAAIGGAAGAAASAALGPVGSMAAGSIGAGAGAGVGGVVGMAITAIVTVLKLSKIKFGYMSTIAQSQHLK